MKIRKIGGLIFVVFLFLLNSVNVNAYEDNSK